MVLSLLLLLSMPTPTTAQSTASTQVGSAFGGVAPTGLNAAQTAAFQGVQQAFAPKITATSPVPTTPVNPTTPTVPSQTPKPQTAFSSDQGATYHADNINKLQSYQTAGLGMDANGYAMTADQHYAEAPSTAIANQNGGFTDPATGINYYSKGLGAGIISSDPVIQKNYDDGVALKAQMDATGAAQIQNIMDQFTSIIKQQGDVNTRSQASLDQSLLMSGSSRYAQQSSSGQSSALVSYGLQQIADLNQKEQSAVLQAQQAMQSNDMKMLDRQLGIAQSARDERQAAAAKLSDALTKANTDLKAKAAQASQEQAVSGIMAQGVTDPSQIQDLMNNYEDGSSTGTNISLDDVNKVIANLNPDAKDVHQVMLSAAQKGASPDILKAIGAARDVGSAITAAGTSLVDPASSYGQYLAYTQQANAKGQNPVPYQDWDAANKAQDAAIKAKADASAAYTNAYNSTAGKNAADAKFASSDKGQNALEQQYRNVLLKEVSNRSGGIGLQDAKVNQAIHLKALVDSYKDANGNYNIPTSQYAELAMGLASLISPSNTTAESDRQNIMAATAKGDLNKAIQWATGTPQNGNTQVMIKNLIDSIDRQGQVSQGLRDQGVMFLHGLAPTGLNQDRIDSLEKNSLADYNNPPQTSSGLIQAESQAQDKIKAYAADPTKGAQVQTSIQTMEQQLGRPITSVELLQAFPEYGQTTQPSSSGGGFWHNVFPDAPGFK